MSLKLDRTIEGDVMTCTDENTGFIININIPTGTVLSIDFISDETDIQTLHAYIAKAKSSYGKFVRSKQFEDYV